MNKITAEYKKLYEVDYPYPRCCICGDKIKPVDPSGIGVWVVHIDDDEYFVESICAMESTEEALLGTFQKWLLQLLRGPQHVDSWDD